MRSGWPYRIEVLGVEVDVVTLEEATDRLIAYWSSPPGPGGKHIVTLNPELLMCALEDPRIGDEFLRVLQDAEMVVPDGIGIVWASRILGTPLPERVPGIELAENALEVAADQGRSVFLLGSHPGVAEAAADNLRVRFPALRVVGTYHGYFTEKEEDAVVARIRDARADLLLVGLGAPRQELWIARHAPDLGARVMIGVGGALDIFAGRARRAPLWLQRLGLEWAFRLVKEPRRLGRMTALPRFVARVLWHQWQRS